MQPAACSPRPSPPPLAPVPRPRHRRPHHRQSATPTPCFIWQVLSHEAPDIRPINVRRELGLVCDECLATEKAAVLELKEGREAKVP